MNRARRYTQPRGEPASAVLVTAPTVEPVSAAEAKAHLRVEHDLDDAYVAALVTAARRHAEALTWRAFVTQSWEVKLDRFPSRCARGRYEPIKLPRGKVQSVTSIKYDDATGAERTLASSAYVVDTAPEPGLIWPAYATVWPETRDNPGAVRVRYVVGVEPRDVAADVKHALLMLVADLYERRESEITGTIVTPVQLAARTLLDPHRLARF